MESFFIIFISFTSWIKGIISHPNTPAYIQAIALLIATVAGFNYLRKRAAEQKFDLIVKTYKSCLEAYDVLMKLKQAPYYFKDRKSLEEFQEIGAKRFTDIVSCVAEGYLASLGKEQELFDNLYNCYAEMRLFFNKEKKALEPITDLLWSRNRIKLLLEILVNSKSQVSHLTYQAQKTTLKIIRDAMVQVWENIELTDWQEEQEKKEEEINGTKRFRKFYYLNDLIKQARNDIDEIFPKLIKGRHLRK